MESWATGGLDVDFFDGREIYILMYISLSKRLYSHVETIQLSFSIEENPIFSANISQ